MNFRLYSEESCDRWRLAIAAGTVQVQTRALVRPKHGVFLAPPRHVLAGNQTLESERAWI